MTLRRSRLCWLIGLALLVGVSSTASASGDGVGRKGKVEPFAVGSVRLLAGPFQRAQELGRRYLLSLEPDRLLAPFHESAGLAPKQPRYKGWESTDLAGHMLGHWLSAVSRMAIVSPDPELSARSNYVVAELASLQLKQPDGYVGGSPRRFFEDVFGGSFTVEEASLAGHWVPWYTLHKLLAGLIDTYQLNGNRQALLVAEGVADWAKRGTDRLTEPQFQRMLGAEFGGMNESLAELFAITGKPAYLALAKRFTHHEVLDPLARSQDRLGGLHANTQIPKLLGAARIYELTGDDYFRRAATYFWEEVVTRRSYVFGGNSKEEHFSAPGAEPLGRKTAETCNTYNMMRLTRKLMTWETESRLADYYENALWNHILASQDPDSGMMLYFLSTKPGHFKVYSKPFDSMWCCTGTGMENTARYTESIYTHDDQSVWVNLYVASQLDWTERGLLLRQETEFPEEPATTITIDKAPAEAMSIYVRVPSWAAGPIRVSVNGSEVRQSRRRDGYLLIRRAWRKGDAMKVELPMALRMVRASDDARKVAFTYGPIVLAGAMGTQGMPASDQSEGPDGPPDSVRLPAPTLVSAAEPVRGIRKVPGKELAFRTDGIGRPQDIDLIPLYRLHHQRYTVYFRLRTLAQWSAEAAAIRAGGGDFWPSPPPPPKPQGRLYEAEEAELAGGAIVASDHDGYSGTGFVGGYFQGTGQQASFTVASARPGNHLLTIRYANGMGKNERLSLYVDGVFVRKLSFTALGDWEKWGNTTVRLHFTKGEHRVALRKDPGDGCVNLDFLVARAPGS